MTREAHKTVTLENFGGLCRYAPATEKAAGAALCNLRRMRDGSLARRAGVVPMVTLPDALRGAIRCEVAGEAVIYAVAGSRIYAVTSIGGDYAYREIGQMQTATGEVSFFTLDGELLMMDGSAMYALSPTEAGVVVPYLPLYGKDWTLDGERPIYQSRNLLTDQVRIRYLVTVPSGTLQLHVSPVSVDAVFRNGVYCDPSGYTINLNANSLDFERYTSKNEVIEVIVTLPAAGDVSRLREAFFSCRCAVRPGEAGRSVALFGGGQEAGVLYLTAPIEEEDRIACRTIAPGCRMLYLQEESRLELGNGLQQPKAMVRHYDRTLIMTDHGTWCTDLKRLEAWKTAPALTAVNSSLGCTEPGAALTVGNHPVSICEGDLLEWNADTDELDECNAASLTAPIAPIKARMRGASARVYYDGEWDELWIYSAAGSSDVLIYQRQSESFTHFSFGELLVRGVFDAGEGVGLLAGNTLYRLDPAVPCDRDASGTRLPIACRFVSHTLSFGHSGQLLRPIELRLCADADAAQPIRVSLTAADGRCVQADMIATGEMPCELVRRIAMGRCRHLCLAVSCDCVGAFTLRAVSVAVGL